MPNNLPSPYRSYLTPKQGIEYQAWRLANHVPDENIGFSSVYDMPGFWKSQNIKGNSYRILNNLDNNITQMKSDGLHYPDTYKTPFHPYYSNESKYKFAGISREWQSNSTGGWDLKDLNTGALITRDDG